MTQLKCILSDMEYEPPSPGRATLFHHDFRLSRLRAEMQDRRDGSKRVVAA